jgi:hypothetical protein
MLKSEKITISKKFQSLSPSRTFARDSEFFWSNFFIHILAQTETNGYPARV